MSITAHAPGVDLGSFIASLFLPAGGSQPASQTNDARLFPKLMQVNGSAAVPLAACRYVGALEQIEKGFVSFPQGWVAALLQLSMLSGAWGENQKRMAQLRQHQLSAILWVAKEDWARTKQMVAWIVHNVLPKEEAFIGGRLGGGAFTSFALKLTRLNWKAALSGAGANFVLASYGSAIMAIQHGQTQIPVIIHAIISGHYDGLCLPVDQMERELPKFDGKDGPDIAPMVQRLEEVWRLTQAAN